MGPSFILTTIHPPPRHPPPPMASLRLIFSGIACCPSPVTGAVGLLGWDDPLGVLGRQMSAVVGAFLRRSDEPPESTLLGKSNVILEIQSLLGRPTLLTKVVSIVATLGA